MSDEFEKAIDIIELEKEKLTEDELNTRAVDAELFYKNHFKRFLALKEYEWLRSLGAKEVSFKESAGQTIYHQGGLLMLKEIDDWFKEQSKTALSRFKKEEEPSQPGESIPRL